MMEDKIQKAIERQFRELSENYNVFGVFLYGSQNYGVDTQDSDIDTKAIIIPTMDDLIFRKPVSKTVKTEVGECDVKDIRNMMSMFRKQNVNFLEILFTDYFYVPEQYAASFGKLMGSREDIARYDEKRAAACILGIFNNEYNRLFREDSEDVQKYGYRRKSYCNINRLHDTMEKYCSPKKPGYKEVISTPEHKILKTKVLPQEMVRANSEIIKANIEKTYHEFEPHERNERLGENLNSIVREIIVSEI